nr:hypothetical protein [Campylobacter jejuni]
MIKQVLAKLMNITHLKDFSGALVSNVYQTSEQAEKADDLWADSGNMINGLKPETLGLSLEEIKNVSQAKYECDFNLICHLSKK